MTMDLDSQARAILRANDRGGYTVPTDGLYPFQWNWDSAFVALGFATFDEDRAWRELETLLAAQWPDGMVPHIVFHQDDPRYFPGAAEYGCSHRPPSSGYTQPPVAAIAALRILEGAKDPAAGRERARPLFAKLLAWHRWLQDWRVDDGVAAIAHPWESGRDNLPDWDAPLACVDTSGIGAYERRDLDHIDAAMRPGREDYDRYVALIREARAAGWDPATMRESGTFRVGDIGMTAILLRAHRALRTLGDRLGAEAGTLAEIDGWIATLAAGVETLWNPATGSYGSLDLRTGRRPETVTSGGLLALFAGGIEKARAEHQAAHLERWLKRVRYVVPSFEPDHPEFEPRRYWRGPVWLVVNWMIAIGLREFGFDDLANRVAADSRELVARNGFHENFDPLTGRGGGGAGFSWTAAIWLELAAARNAERGG